MRTHRLGGDGPELSEVGLGCMGMSDFYGAADEAESRATIRAAIDAGVTLLGALAPQLTSEELTRIEAAVPAASVAGDRYDPPSMVALDSERASSARRPS